MTHDRWEEIKSSLHFNDNLSMPPADSSPKDRLFQDSPTSRDAAPKIGGDSSGTMPLCGRTDGSIQRALQHQAIPPSPRSLTSHIDQVPRFPDIGASGNIVIKLAQCVQPQLGHLLYFDN
ncbi:hypothetical protein HPB47_006899 [Ixodes persulcatus]|uniref:Uncharacterized protein n=1 Tax=Ixodes persulcatus TaxID=34615 RepID=A0AC60P976_IXOPE|nr:hypothetical protein HPB47_006899 [Ixodes persulcatus]